ncbi:ABC transporter substrate-binding protein [Treponema brennaborense]|uniref:Extracellular solute-binding protein family 1 n=1 Tax=Treponema brennaborense (strain DSM 12168 / CIP 105900 / DD5/3) TaxID=906968 RepID=F4LNL9_TREBD|nr:extracellular solute-binding protein [Treponema brennaborense]AEE15873.1 extracellular solute-binding protein family 1 [Treponema brennaborense DSM 12168]
MSIKKFTAILLAVSVLVCTVSAGGTKDGSANGKIVLKVLDYADSTAPNAFDDNTYVWEAFEKANPDIIIQREVLFNEPFHQKSAAYAASGNMPDVFYMWPGGRSTAIHTQHLAKDLKPLLEKDGLLADYSTAAMDPAGQIANYIAEIPFGITTTHVMYVNTDILKECGLSIPKTYEELKAQVPVLKAKGYETILMANMDDWVMQSCLFSLVAGRFGGPAWADNIVAGKSKFTDEFMQKAVGFVKQMYDDNVLNKSTLATSYGDVVGLFASGKGAYMIDGDWRAGAFITDQSTGQALISPAKQKSSIEMVTFPAIPGEVVAGSNSSTLGVGYGMSAAIPAGSAKEQAAWKLIKWLSGPVVQQRRLDTGASFPSLAKGIVFDEAKMEPLMIKRVQFYQNAGAVTPVFDSKFEGDVNVACNVGLQQLGLGKKSAADVCKDMQKAWEAFKK